MTSHPPAQLSFKVYNTQTKETNYIYQTQIHHIQQDTQNMKCIYTTEFTTYPENQADNTP